MFSIGCMRIPHNVFRTDTSLPALVRFASRAVVGLVALTAATAQAVPLLSLERPDAGVEVGDSYTVDVRIAEAAGLYTFNLDVAYDSDFLRFDGATTGGFLESGGLTTAALFGGLSPDITAGRVDDLSNSLLAPVPGVSGGGILASLAFTVLLVDPGAPSFLAVNQPAGTELVDAAGERVAVATTEVPSPAPLALLMPGLGLLILAARRR